VEQLPSVIRGRSKSSSPKWLPFGHARSGRGFIKGSVAFGNNGEPHEKTKSYRLVTFNAEAKTQMKALAAILGENQLKKNGT
jgi:hypothetical protein